MPASGHGGDDRVLPMAEVDGPLVVAAKLHHTCGVIDRRNRDIAAALVRQFRDGDITNDELDSTWPHSNQDQALAAIGSMMWRTYDDGRTHKLKGPRTPTPELQSVLTRFAAFLDGDLPYEWPKTNFISIGGLGLLVPLSLGVLWPVDRWIKYRNARSDAKLAAVGDLEAWPFIRKSDYAR